MRPAIKHSLSGPLLICFLFGHVWGQAAPALKLQRQETLGKKQQLEEERLRVSEQEESILRELQQLDQALSREQKDLQEYEAKMKANRAELERLNTEMLQLEQTSRAYRRRAASRIRGIYKLRYHGYSPGALRLLLSSNDLGQWLSRYRYLRAVTEADQHLIEQIAEQYAVMLATQQQLSGQRRELHQASLLVRQSRKEILEKRTQRQQMLEQLQQDKERYNQAIRELEQQIGKFEGRIGDLTEAGSTPLRYSISPRDLGKLPWPVEGKTVPNVNKVSRGVTIRAPHGTPIRAVADGRVRQIDWVLGYGNVIILDHGDDYFSIYAHLSEVLVQSGDTLKRGEVIARLGESGSLIGPVLYFEIWKGKTPLNTLKWLQRKAE